MSSREKEYKIKIKGEKDVSAFDEVRKSLMGIQQVVMVALFPLTMFFHLLRVGHRTMSLLGLASTQTAAETEVQTTSVAAATIAQAAYNTQLATTVALMGGLTGGATTAAAIAGLGALRGAMAVTSLQTAPGQLKSVAKTGLAEVHEGEKFFTGGGGVGGGDVHIHIGNVSLDPNGMDLTDFTSQLGESLRSSLRANTRSIPT